MSKLPTHSAPSPTVSTPFAAPATPAAKLNSVKLLYDTWDSEGVRHGAGTILSLPLEYAKQLVATGKAERADPYPGEL